MIFNFEDCDNRALTSAFDILRAKLPEARYHGIERVVFNNIQCCSCLRNWLAQGVVRQLCYRDWSEVVNLFNHRHRRGRKRDLQFVSRFQSLLGSSYCAECMEKVADEMAYVAMTTLKRKELIYFLDLIQQLAKCVTSESSHCWDERFVTPLANGLIQRVPPRRKRIVAGISGVIKELGLL